MRDNMSQVKTSLFALDQQSEFLKLNNNIIIK